MGNLSLQDSQHAPQGGPPGRAAYIPPHLRGRPGASMDSAPPAGPGAGPGPGFSGTRYDI
jgi:ATP-dependent RNA helicase DDX3X